MVGVLVGIGLGLAAAWAGLAVFLVLAGHGAPGITEVLRLLPDVVRLLHRLARDPEIPRATKVRLWLLLTYLAVPIDLVPDFIPVIGYADDAIIVAAVLRSVVRRSGAAVVRRSWPGSEAGLDALLRAAGIAEADQGSAG